MSSIEPVLSKSLFRAGLGRWQQAQLTAVGHAAQAWSRQVLQHWLLGRQLGRRHHIRSHPVLVAAPFLCKICYPCSRCIERDIAVLGAATFCQLREQVLKIEHCHVALTIVVPVSAV